MSRTHDTETSRVSDDGRTTIPKSLREKYGIEPGDTVVWEDTDEGLVVRAVLPDHGRGLWNEETSSETEREAVAQALEAAVRDRRDAEWTVE